MPVLIKASKSDISPNVVTCGDPSRVDHLSSILEDARVVSTYRGFKVVTGSYKGARVTLAAHGIGGPSAAMVFEELKLLGAKRIVRLGTAGGVRKDTRIGDIVVATSALYHIGGCAIGQYIPGYCGPTGSDPRLTSRIMDLLEGGGIEYKYGPVFTSDAFYAESPELAESLARYGVVAVDMESATLFSLGWMRGFEAACILVISNVLHSREAYREILTQELTEKFIRVGRVLMDVFNKYYRVD